MKFLGKYVRALLCTAANVPVQLHGAASLEHFPFNAHPSERVKWFHPPEMKFTIAGMFRRGVSELYQVPRKIPLKRIPMSSGFPEERSPQLKRAEDYRCCEKYEQRLYFFNTSGIYARGGTGRRFSSTPLGWIVGRRIIPASECISLALRNKRMNHKSIVIYILEFKLITVIRTPIETACFWSIKGIGQYVRVLQNIIENKASFHIIWDNNSISNVSQYLNWLSEQF